MSTGLADRLQKLMDERGLKAAPLARQAGLKVDFVRDILRGRTRSPQAANLAKLAEHLDVPVDYLTAHSTRPMPKPGFSEPDVVAFQNDAPDAAEKAIAIKRLYPDARNLALMVSNKNLPQFSILRGDTLVCDLSRGPLNSDLVIATSVDTETGEASSSVYRYFHPYLIRDTQDREGGVIIADNNVNSVSSILVGIVRGILA